MWLSSLQPPYAGMRSLQHLNVLQGTWLRVSWVLLIRASVSSLAACGITSRQWLHRYMLSQRRLIGFRFGERADTVINGFLIGFLIQEVLTQLSCTRRNPGRALQQHMVYYPLRVGLKTSLLRPSLTPNMSLRMRPGIFSKLLALHFGPTPPQWKK